MASPIVTVSAPPEAPPARAADNLPPAAATPVIKEPIDEAEKPRLQKRHTVTLAMSKSSEKLHHLSPKKALIRYGVYGLQGKRDAMEDAHVAVPNCPPTQSPGGSVV